MKTSNFFIFSFFLIFISGCDKPNEAPEFLDKVYLELVRELSETVKIKDNKLKELATITKTAESLKPRSRESRVARETILRIKKEVDKIEQDILYKRLRIRSRAEQDRREYMSAWKAKSVWPRPESFNNYILQRKLASAPRTWSRVAPERKKENKIKKAPSSAAPTNR